MSKGKSSGKVGKSAMVTFFDAKPYDEVSFNGVNQEFGYQLVFHSSRLSPATAKLAEGSEVVCVFVNDDVGGAVVEKLTELGVGLIALRCAGYNNVDLGAVYGKIPVVRVPAYSPHAVAEHAVALIMSLNRKTPRAYNRVRDNNFSINGLMGFDIFGKTVGVAGAGKIGIEFVRIMRGFGTKVLVFDPRADAKLAKKEGFEYVELDELYRQSDIVSLHCPLTPETRYMVDARAIGMMRDGVMIINTSRGQLVDTQALIKGLKSGKVGHAGLDVYEEESEYFFEDHSQTIVKDDLLARLTSFPNVLVTSHQAFFTKEAMANIADTTLGNIRAFLANTTLENEICYRCGASPCLKQKGAKRCFEVKK